MKPDASPKREYPHGAHLEPRVAKLELGMERLTDDVRDLAQVVRSQGQNMEGEIQKLVVAVTQASGPKKTDWGTIIAGLALIMAIGSAAFWPLNQTVQENKEAIVNIEHKYDEHSKIANHPVGEALIQRLEEQLKAHIDSNNKQMADHMIEARDMHETIRTHFHEELTLLSKTYELQLDALKEKTQLHDDRLFQRVVKLEDQNRIDAEREKDELQMWRQKAMGLNGTPTTHTHIETDSSTKK